MRTIDDLLKNERRWNRARRRRCALMTLIDLALMIATLAAMWWFGRAL